MQRPFQLSDEMKLELAGMGEAIAEESQTANDAARPSPRREGLLRRLANSSDSAGVAPRQADDQAAAVEASARTDPSGEPITAQQRADPALRYDAGKPRFELIPADSLEALAWVYTQGANKYADRNWEKGMAWSRVFGSLMRHAWAFWKGETHDAETGCHHMAMAAWNCLALCSYSMRGVGDDNRPVD